MSKKIVLYTQECCPVCTVIKSCLDSNNIPYTECTDREKILALGYNETPLLAIGDKVYRSGEAYRAILSGELKGELND